MDGLSSAWKFVEALNRPRMVLWRILRIKNLPWQENAA